jgi:hypothetical protein
MSKAVCRLAGAVAVAVAPMAYVAAVSLGVSSAQPPDCGPGNFYNPAADACQPLGPPPPPDCGPGNFFNPAANTCQPLGPPPPPDCGPGNFFNPAIDGCQPLGPPPPPQ